MKTKKNLSSFYEHLYRIREDGKIHTRYTELLRCTPGGAERTVMEKLGLAEPYGRTGGALEFGSIRHQMWEDESKQTGRTPEVFREAGVDWPVDHVEAEFASEVFKDVVLHSRTDAYSPEHLAVIDYKTSNNTGADLVRRMQLHVYGYQLMLHGIPVKQGIYLVEQWEKGKQHIVGYRVWQHQIRMQDFLVTRDWLRQRAERLVVALDVVKEKYANYLKEA